VEATDAVTRIGEALHILSDHINERAGQFNGLHLPNGSYNVHGAQRVAMRTAEDMEQFVARDTVETPIMAAAIQQGIQAFGNAASFALVAGESARSGLEQAVASVAEMRSHMEHSRTNRSSLHATVASLPRMQRDFNVAKRKTVAVFDQFLCEIESGINLADTLERSMQRILADLSHSVDDDT
jgi:hypothetical protein